MKKKQKNKITNLMIGKIIALNAILFFVLVGIVCIDITPNLHMSPVMESIMEWAVPVIIGVFIAELNALWKRFGVHVEKIEKQENKLSKK